MPLADPSSLDLGSLFRDPDMFDSRRTWSSAGFHVIARDNNGKIMVARHALVPGLLFKKYARDVDEKDQTKNYERRVEGANRLRAFITSRRLTRVTVPRKWLLELPQAFSRRARSYVLVVEQLDLLDDVQTKAAYHRIDPNVLAELAVVLYHFRGMDSNAKNLPFTVDGRIAFIDTEHWDRSTSKDYLHHVGAYLTKERRKLAGKLFDQLEDGEDPYVGGFVDDAFDDEEDTNSSSSSSSFSS